MLDTAGTQGSAKRDTGMAEAGDALRFSVTKRDTCMAEAGDALRFSVTCVLWAPFRTMRGVARGLKRTSLANEQYTRGTDDYWQAEIVVWALFWVRFLRRRRRLLW